MSLFIFIFLLFVSDDVTELFLFLISTFSGVVVLDLIASFSIDVFSIGLRTGGSG